jgi:hypothetical protein
MFCITCSAVYGADEEEVSREDYRLLTPQEQAFFELINIKKKNSVMEGVYTMTHFSLRLSQGRYNNRESITRTLNWYRENPPDCNIQSAPPIFERYRTEWNSELCPGIVTWHGKVISSLEDALEDPDIMEEHTYESPTIINPRLADQFIDLAKEGSTVGEIAIDISSEVVDLTRELVKARKKLREKAKEKAKELTKKGDNGDTGGNGTNGDNGDNEDNGDKEEKEGSEDLLDSECYVATAAYGKPEAEEIDILRRYRDEFLLHNHMGKAFVAGYYATSPPVAQFISEHEALRFIIRESFVSPAVELFVLTESWWAE